MKLLGEIPDIMGFLDDENYNPMTDSPVCEPRNRRRKVKFKRRLSRLRKR
jgi:hypothetical protein